MSVDRFLIDSGIVHTDGELSDAGRDALLRCASSFLAVGGVLSWADWHDMAPTTREVFEDASRAVWAERIATVALSLGVRFPQPRRNPTAPENREAWETAHTDDGEDQDACEAVMDRILAGADD